MQAEVSRGYLDYQDERGCYSVPIGRRSRKCLVILDKKEGEFVRSLEIDLFTGNVYYSVNNETGGGLSYYYDMSSKKVGHYFIHRYLRLARDHGLTIAPLESEIFEKLPCENWIEELERLPGWKEAIDNRIQDLLLPWKEVVKVSLPEISAGCIAQDPADKKEIASISFVQSPAAYPAGAREYVRTRRISRKTATSFGLGYAPDSFDALLTALREKGFTVLMDDFGSGYSTLNMLKNLNIDIIKLDAQFLRMDESNEEKWNPSPI